MRRGLVLEVLQFLVLLATFSASGPVTFSCGSIVSPRSFLRLDDPRDATGEE